MKMKMVLAMCLQGRKRARTASMTASSASSSHVSFWWFALIFVALFRVPSSVGLSNLLVSIPPTVVRGQDVALNCSFNLQDDSLYALKWYRGTHELYRFSPGQNPRVKIFPLDGYNISVSRSTGRTLYLSSVDYGNSGSYTCEVIADGSFVTLMDTKKMTVVDYPDDKPRITGVNGSYEVGERVKAICTSWQSNPPANLSWFINAEPARDDYLRRAQVRPEYDNTYTSVLELQFEVLPGHFRGNTMVLKCASSMLDAYWESTEVRIKQRSPRPSLIVNGGGGGQRPRHNHGSADNNDNNDNNADVRRRKGRKRKKEEEAKSEKKMPVEQLTSHVLSTSSEGRTTSTFWAVMLAAILLNLRWTAR